MQEDMNFDHTEAGSLENMLRSIRPSSGRLDREQIMYCAGEQAARIAMKHSRLRWMASTAGMSCVSLVLCVLLITSQGNGTVAETNEDGNKDPAKSFVSDEHAPPFEKQKDLHDIPELKKPETPSLIVQGDLDTLDQIRRRVFNNSSEPDNYLALRDLTLYQTAYDGNRLDHYDLRQTTANSSNNISESDHVTPTARRLLRQFLNETSPTLSKESTFPGI